MKIPPDALIPAAKLTKYLLVAKAKDDKSRYLARGGFDQTNPKDLELALRRAIEEVEAEIEQANQHGTYYNVRCELSGPGGRRLPVVLIWLCRLDGKYSFVTLIPDTESRS